MPLQHDGPKHPVQPAPWHTQHHGSHACQPQHGMRYVQLYPTDPAYTPDKDTALLLTATHTFLQLNTTILHAPVLPQHLPAPKSPTFYPPPQPCLLKPRCPLASTPAALARTGRPIAAGTLLPPAASLITEALAAADARPTRRTQPASAAVSPQGRAAAPAAASRRPQCGEVLLS